MLPALLRRRRRPLAGFTLIELLIVIIIIGRRYLDPDGCQLQRRCCSDSHLLVDADL